MLNIKNDITGICKNCSHAHIYKQQDSGHATINCAAYGGWYAKDHPVPDNITECSLFKGPQEMDIFEMKRIAWNIEITRKAGFTVLTPHERNRND